MLTSLQQAAVGHSSPPPPRPSSLPRTRTAACRPHGPARERRGSPGACAAAWAAGPSLGGGARRGGPHGKGEVRWPLPPPPPRFVARRKMADLDEQLSDEEKVRVAEAAESVVEEPVEPRRISPASGRPERALVCALGCPSSSSRRCALMPAPVSHPRPRAGAGLCQACSLRSAPCRVCALKIGSGSRAAAPGAAGGGGGRGGRWPLGTLSFRLGRGALRRVWGLQRGPGPGLGATQGRW